MKKKISFLPVKTNENPGIVLIMHELKNGRSDVIGDRLGYGRFSIALMVGNTTRSTEVDRIGKRGRSTKWECHKHRK